MPIQFLFPTGLPFSQNLWINQSGHSINSADIGTKDIDEGIPADDSDFIVDVRSSISKVLYVETDPLLVDVDLVTFRIRLQASGDFIIPQYAVQMKLRDTQYQDVAEVGWGFFGATEPIPLSLTDGFVDLEASVVGNSNLPLDIDWSTPVISLDITPEFGDAAHSGVVISALEVEVSGKQLEEPDNISLFMYAGQNHQFEIKPEQNCDLKDYKVISGLNYSFNNRFAGHVDELMPSSIFNLGYFPFNESGAVYFPVQPGLDISGVLRYDDASLVEDTTQYNYYTKTDTPINFDYEETVVASSTPVGIDFNLGQKLGIGSFLHSGETPQDIFIHFNSGLLNIDSWSMYFNIHHSGSPFSTSHGFPGQILFQYADHEGSVTPNASGTGASFYVDFDDKYSLIGFSG